MEKTVAIDVVFESTVIYRLFKVIQRLGYSIFPILFRNVLIITMYSFSKVTFNVNVVMIHYQQCNDAVTV